jgi:FtsP/CotA-like multicopper oxidase with cupredoxin domain
VRLRLLNASNTRVYNFGFTDGRSFDVIAGDSGLLASPVRTDRVDLAPGERAEVVVGVRTGDDTVLRSFPLDLGTGPLADRVDGAHDTMEILRLRAAPTLAPTRPVPDRLVPAPRAVAPPGAVTRTFNFSGRSINGRPYAPDRADAVATVDTSEVWEVSASSELHVFHLHDVRFRVIDIDGDRPPPLLAGWKDTLRLVPSHRYRLVVRFEDHADPTAAFMFHCHILEHEDQGMMAQVVVVEPGGSPDLHGGAHGVGGQPAPPR